MGHKATQHGIASSTRSAATGPSDMDPAATGSSTRRQPQLLRRLGRDYAYVMPGLPLAALSFAVLLGLTAASFATLVIWIGALLLTLTLMLASMFAGLSRRRVAAWGTPLAPVEHRPVERGLRGIVRLVTDPRRWLDLAFEMVIAFPVRLFTFVVAAVWTGIALGGVTYWIWSPFLPEDSQGWAYLLSLGFPEQIPQTTQGIYLLDAGINFALGVAFLLTLPMVMRGLAWLDASLTATLLGRGYTAPPARPDSPVSGRADDRVTDPQDVQAAGTADLPVSGTAVASVRSFSHAGWVWAGTIIPAIVFVAVGWPILAAMYGMHPAVAMVLAVSHSASILLAVRSASAGIGLAAFAAIGTMFVTSDVAAQTVWPWPVTALLAQCVVVTVIALRYRWWWAVAAWTTGAGFTVAAFVLIGQIPSGSLSNGVVLATLTAGLAALGIVARLWRQSASRVQHAEELSFEEAQRRQDLQERNRIARELHDVVAHSMSVINVQASTAQYRKPGINTAIQQEFDDIAESSRRALSEMRALLAILRNDDAAPTAPVPGLNDIRDLIEATRASGASISYSGVDTDVAPTVGLTAFRVIQEALSNALRHAPGASIEVTTSISDDRQHLTVEVVNSAPNNDVPASPGAGLGLTGIRERVAALGATVEAGPTSTGGFAVATSLPLTGGGDETS